jgi:hypothetical protein
VAWLGGDGVHLATNMRGHDMAPVILAALSEHVGVAEPLMKAATPDPKNPNLETLLGRSLADLQAWVTTLLEALLAWWRGRKPSRFDAEMERELRAVFGEHEEDLVVRFAGILGYAAEAPDTHPARLPALGSYVEAAALLGSTVDPTSPLVELQAPRLAWEAFGDALGRIPLDAQTREAVLAMQRRGAIYMRRPAQRFEDEVVRTLLDHERQLSTQQLATIREAGAVAVAEQMSVADFERVLKDLADATLTNDMARVSRTELAQAAAWGAYAELKKKAAEIGEPDPLVYKVTSVTACQHCFRIWGSRGAIRYRLSELERWEALGGNFHKPAREWRATIGPVHPQCFPPGVRITTSAGDKPIEDVRVGDLVFTHKGRWRRVTRTFRHHYDGMLVNVNGVPATAEHPFLTSRGWVDARDLMLDDQLFEPVEVLACKSNDSPSLADEVRFLALVLFSLGASLMPLPSINLDRKLVFRHGKIDQEPTDLERRRRFHASLRERLMEGLFERGVKLAGLSGYHPTDGLLALGLAAYSSMGVRSIPLSLFRGELGVSQLLGLGGCPGLEANGGQPPNECGPVNGQHLADRQQRKTLIEVQDTHLFGGDVGARLRPRALTGLRRSHGSLVVHNLSVQDDESYLAEGIVTHNCTCGPLFLYTGDDLHARMLAAVDEMVEEGKRMRAAAAAGG